MIKIVGRIKHVLEQTEELIKKNEVRVETRSVTDDHHTLSDMGNLDETGMRIWALLQYTARRASLLTLLVRRLFA
jgi:hypothetical protein